MEAKAPRCIAIEIPVAKEIRDVADRLRMPYDHVRRIVTDHALPVLSKAVEGRVKEIVFAAIARELVPVTPEPMLSTEDHEKALFDVTFDDEADAGVQS
jgi:hypothetical protein